MTDEEKTTIIRLVAEILSIVVNDTPNAAEPAVVAPKVTPAKFPVLLDRSGKKILITTTALQEALQQTILDISRNEWNPNNYGPAE